MSREIVTYQAADPTTGEVREFKEEYEIEEHSPHSLDNTSVTAYQVYGGVVSTGFGYTDKTRESLLNSLKNFLIRKSQEWVQQQLQRHEAEKIDDQFKATVYPKLLAIGYTPENDAYLFSVIDTGLDESGMKLLNRLLEILDVPSDISPSAAVKRKVIKSALTNGKLHARSEYPEEYRDSDEKEDFYDQYITDVAIGFVEAL